MSDEDIIRVASQAGWDVQNLDDGFGERLRRFAQAMERKPLYTAPPKTAEWVGLTDEEINSVRYQRDWTAPWTDTNFARAIEAKLREKNT